jgi:type I restriction enzyme R subunit
MPKEARARILINVLLKRSGWRFFDDDSGPANIALEPHVKIKKKTLDAFGDDFEGTADGFIDYLLLDDRGFPVAVLEAKAEKFEPLIGNEKTRVYARSQFADYIAEHLNPGGRAGIIVPEGIIFQSQTAYKSLRKILVSPPAAFRIGFT